MLALDDYRTVIALDEERRFGPAARRLGVTQPALTARLRRIEQDVGARLFERGRHGAAPTPAGAAFVAGARRVLDAAEDAARAVRDRLDGYGETLRIGVTQVSAYAVAPDCLARFRATQPLVRLRLQEGSTAILESKLEAGEIDAAFLHPPLHAPGLSETLLASTPLEKRDLGAGAHTAAPVAFPRAEAPVMMAALGRQTGAGGGRGEANTILGAIILSQAGYGPCFTPKGYPHPALGAVAAEAGDFGVFETSLAWRALDRRPALRAFVAAASQK